MANLSDLKTGDSGQRYEIRYCSDKSEGVFGWSSSLDGAAAFVRSIDLHPVMGSPRVLDRETGTEIPIAAVRSRLTSTLRATADIYAERQRQIRVEGYSAKHDDAHSDGELLAAALCYYREAINANSYRPDGVPLAWPWDNKFWKPDGDRRNLVRAGGLLLAERDRVKRQRGNVEPVAHKLRMVIEAVTILPAGIVRPIGTDLFLRTIKFNYGDQERSDLMRDVWLRTPFMVNALTGPCGDARERAMLDWCQEKFGPQCFPIHGVPGCWQRGGATVNGRTWFGFDGQAALDEFLARWPATETIEG